MIKFLSNIKFFSKKEKINLFLLLLISLLNQFLELIGIALIPLLVGLVFPKEMAVIFYLILIFFLILNLKI